jgi:capsular exopolysaccharide synthesis family protein
MAETRPSEKEESFQDDWEEMDTLDHPAAIEGTTSDERLPAPPTAFQKGLESSYQEFSQLFAAIESRGAGTGHDIQSPDNRNGHILGITSALVGEGKTTVALNLAMSTARSTNSKVCLIDLGLTGESVLQRLGTSADGAGIVHVLEGVNQTFPMLRLRDFEELTIIPAGKVPSNPARIARSPRMAEVLDSARRMFDLILIDMPAIATHNARPMAAHMDGIVMITRAGVTPQDVITNAMDHIGREKILGVVLNRVQFAGPRWLQKRLMQR